jgi:peptidoglycan hydrolase-like protein with peptidoglycan-binding domain
MRNLLLSTVAVLALAAAMPASAQQSRSNQPSTAQQPSAAQQSMQEQNLSKDEIQQVQQALDQKGFKSGRPDGVLGPETKNAIKEFQQKQGWNASGELDNQTLSALGVSTNGQNATGQQPRTTGEQHPSNPSGQNSR